jgi:hypothetical protein
MNSIFKIAISVYLMILSFIIINLIAGPGGLLNYKQLDLYKTTISGNIGDLEGINRSLQIESERLIHDSDEIKIKARELGWVDRDEGVIVVRGFNHSEAGYSMGKLLSRESHPRENLIVHRLVAVMIGLVFYIGIGFIGKNQRLLG